MAALALSQLAAPAIAHRLAGDFLSTGATNDAAITPVGYAFGIWGLICALCAGTAVAVVRFGLGAPWELRVLTEASVVFIGFSVWLWVAAHDWLWASVAVFALMAAALVDVARLCVYRGDELACPRWMTWLTTTTFGLYLGWSSIAVFVNVAAALVFAGWSPDRTAWQAVILLAATAAAIFLTIFLRGAAGYVAGALWALVAAAVGADDRNSPVLAAASLCAVALVGGTALTVRARQRRRHPEPHTARAPHR